MKSNKPKKQKQDALEKWADELLKRDEEAQKLKQLGKKVDVKKFKDLL